MFTDRKWRNLLTDIEARHVIPIIGPELAVLDLPGQPTLYQHLARELATRLPVPADRLPAGYDLLDVTSLYLQDPRNRADELHYETLAILSERAWPVPEPLGKLAAITHFDLFVSTTFDALLVQALNETRFQGMSQTRMIAYSERSQVEDLPADFDKSPSATVFQLFGKLDKFGAIGDYGITEEKILEFSHRLQSRDFRPKNIFDELRAKNLLTLGCNLPGWLARFFLRASKGEQLLTQGASGLVADRTSQLDGSFVMFLERRQIAVYTEGDAVQFVEELHRRWMERFGTNGPSAVEAAALPPAGPAGAEFKQDSVFISYASDDRRQALQVKQACDEAGVDAWFDRNELLSGDDFRLKIELSIENCSYFVPLISQHTARMEKRFFWREWNKAIDEAAAFPRAYGFIQPLRLDDTPLPPEFRSFHARRLEELPQFIEDAKKKIRERRLQRRPT